MSVYALVVIILSGIEVDKNTTGCYVADQPSNEAAGRVDAIFKLKELGTSSVQNVDECPVHTRV